MVGAHAGSVSSTKVWGVPAAGALGVVLGAVVGVTLTSPPMHEAWRQVVGEGSSLTASEWPAPELGREWRWTPKAVAFEVMFPRER